MIKLGERQQNVGDMEFEIRGRAEKGEKRSKDGEKTGNGGAQGMQ